ncbi:MAG: SUF system Fe-S cluster assembly protein [Gammaproteobacteria bacterium]|nr:SUF system Fe-S cluster assembly protein [Gammaproteobacteria bacterium]
MGDHLKDIRIKSVSTLHQERRQDIPVEPGSPAVSPEDGLRERAIAALRTIYDPEIPVNIYELGLIYTLDVNESDGVLYVEMTLTAPGCPVAQTFPGTVEARLREVEGVEEVTVKLVWEPTWTQDRMTEAARLQLGLL